MSLQNKGNSGYNGTPRIYKRRVDHLTSESQKRAVRKYDDKATKQIKMKLNLKTDADILQKLDEVGNIQGYIKALIRKDLNE